MSEHLTIEQIEKYADAMNTQVAYEDWYEKAVEHVEQCDDCLAKVLNQIYVNAMCEPDQKILSVGLKLLAGERTRKNEDNGKDSTQENKTELTE